MAAGQGRTLDERHGRYRRLVQADPSWNAAAVSLGEDVSELLTAALQRHDLPGAIVGVRSPAAYIEIAAGLANVSTGEPLTPELGFRLMSIVKPVVGLAFARLVEQGRIAWSDTVGSLLSDLRGTGPGSATVDQLLGMTAGLAEVPLAPPEAGDTPSALVPLIAAAGLADAPGAAWSYSNPAFGLLGRILEVVAEADWREVLVELVLEPAGMTSVSILENLAFPTATEHLDKEPIEGIDMEAFGAAGTRLWATMTDLLALGSALLRPDATPLRDEQAVVPVPYLADAWGRGLARFDWPEATAFGWDGIGVGVRNLLRVIPARDVVVAMTVNGSRGRLLWDDLVPAVVQAVGGGKVPALRFEPSGDAVDHAPLVGTYERAGLPPAQVSTDGADLVVHDLFGRRALRPVRGDLFLSNPNDADWPTVTLRPDAYYVAGFHFHRTESGLR